MPDYVVSIPLPAGAVVNQSLLVVSWFDTEGNLKYGVSQLGEASLSSRLGLLELAKADILADEGPASQPLDFPE